MGIFFFLLVWKFRAPVVPFQASANSFFQVPVFLPCKESTMPKPNLELSCGFLSMLPSLFPLGISTLLQGYKGLKLRQSQAKIQGFLESPFCYPLANYLYLLHPLPAPSPTPAPVSRTSKCKNELCETCPSVISSISLFFRGKQDKMEQKERRVSKEKKETEVLWDYP